MQISLNIQDDVYQKLVSTGVDMQAKINEYLVNLADKKSTYLHTQQFQENKAYFHQALEDIESGKDELIPFDDGLDDLDTFIDNVK